MDFSKSNLTCVKVTSFVNSYSGVSWKVITNYVFGVLIGGIVGLSKENSKSLNSPC